MKSDVVIVTTYEREELLFLCLEAIRAQDATTTIWVYSDRGANSDQLRAACLAFDAISVVRGWHARYGNSWNLLDACRVLAIPGRRIVHLIEDDTIIHPEYLEWAREKLEENSGGISLDSLPPIVQTNWTFAAVCGRIGSPHIQNWYESPCASWNADFLRLALGHLVPEYFTNTRAKMQEVIDGQMFPRSKYRRGGAEQDGFFLRCIEHHKWRTTFPPTPLATHLGHYGYNRHGRSGPEGSFEARIQFTRELLADRKRRIELFGSDITNREMGALNDR